MIYDKIENVEQYFTDDALMEKALDYIRNFDSSTAEGLYKVDGDDITARVVSYELDPAAPKNFEAHRIYIDVQVILEGRERLDVTHAEDLPITMPYNAEKDAELYEGPIDFTSLVMDQDMIAIFYPQDLHRPASPTSQKQKIRKLVVKVRL
jgi:YhcH/YjgK/YiaL family protein